MKNCKGQSGLALTVVLVAHYYLRNTIVTWIQDAGGVFVLASFEWPYKILSLHWDLLMNEKLLELHLSCLAASHSLTTEHASQPQCCLPGWKLDVIPLRQFSPWPWITSEFLAEARNNTHPPHPPAPSNNVFHKLGLAKTLLPVVEDLLNVLLFPLPSCLRYSSDVSTWSWSPTG